MSGVPADPSSVQADSGAAGSPTKRCSKCGRFKTLDQFMRLREGWRSECSECTRVASRKRSRKDPRTAICLRMPEDVHDRLAQAAEDRGLSMNWLALRAVEEYLDRLIPAEEMRLTRA